MKITRKLLLASLCIIILATIGISGLASGITVRLNGEALTFDQPPIIQEGRTLVPLRVIFEALGATVDWEQSTQTVTAVRDGVTVTMQIGSSVFYRNGQEFTLDVPARVVNNRTLVPARAVAESFGADVQWNQEAQTVFITTSEIAQGQETHDTVRATIVMEDGGIIVLELYPHLAPQSVSNFVYLAQEGFYDGLKFHRIISGFMVQGGCPFGTGTGGPGYTIKGEFALNGIENDLKHERGVISMARSNAFDSAGSQFFIMHDDVDSLDGQYAAFGRVAEGMEVVDRIAATPNSGSNGAVAPENMPVISSITIYSNITLPEPNRL